MSDQEDEEVRSELENTEQRHYDDELDEEQNRLGFEAFLRAQDAGGSRSSSICLQYPRSEDSFDSSESNPKPNKKNTTESIMTIVTCPICEIPCDQENINEHLDKCLGATDLPPGMEKVNEGASCSGYNQSTWCPICDEEFPNAEIDAHASKCAASVFDLDPEEYTPH